MENRSRVFVLKSKDNTLRADINIDKMNEYFNDDSNFTYNNIKHDYVYKIPVNKQKR